MHVLMTFFDSLFVLTNTLKKETDLASSREATYFQNMLIQLESLLNNKRMSNAMYYTNRSELDDVTSHIQWAFRSFCKNVIEKLLILGNLRLFSPNNLKK